MFLCSQKKFVVGETLSEEEKLVLGHIFSANVAIWHLASIFSILIAVIVVRSHIGTQLAVLTPLCYHFVNGIRIWLCYSSPVSSMGWIHIILGIVCLIIYNKD